jgi:hypothetical protein
VHINQISHELLMFSLCSKHKLILSWIKSLIFFYSFIYASYEYANMYISCNTLIYTKWFIHLVKYWSSEEKNEERFAHYRSIHFFTFDLTIFIPLLPNQRITNVKQRFIKTWDNRTQYPLSGLIKNVIKFIRHVLIVSLTLIMFQLKNERKVSFIENNEKVKKDRQ